MVIIFQTPAFIRKIFLIPEYLVEWVPIVRLSINSGAVTVSGKFVGFLILLKTPSADSVILRTAMF
jgi:hypothetical protein